MVVAAATGIVLKAAIEIGIGILDASKRAVTVSSKKLTLQQLEAHLWGAANILRGKTAGQDYKTRSFR
jgi:hypothetical protein